jgi:hypothetical protein
MSERERPSAGPLAGTDLAERERRLGPRVPLSIWVEEKCGPGVLFRRSGNLSAGGIYLEVAVPQPVGTPLELEFTLPSEPGPPVRIRGVVVSSAAQSGSMSVSFVDVPPEIQARIASCVGRGGQSLGAVGPGDGENPDRNP